MRTTGFHKEHLVSINKWRKLHGQAPVKRTDLPAIGVLVPGVAAGFLRMVEGGSAIMDGLITNPRASGASRHAALEAVFKKLISVPGFHTIIGYTLDDGARSRAQLHGFKEKYYSVMVRS